LSLPVIEISIRIVDFAQPFWVRRVKYVIAMGHDLLPAVQRFREAAKNFIETVDSLSKFERDIFLASVSCCLADLYSSALYLPAVEPETEAVDETPFPTAQWAKLFQSIKEKIGPLDVYWTVFDSTEKEAPVQGSLAQDISEIYYDLRQDFQLEEKTIPPADFLWSLRESFREHWGRHAIEALKAIQALHL
jgi:hypothetical protein